MAKASLRIYNREIESLIEGGHLDEAIAHCLHILKTFPMHVETYRLFGKAFLEGRRYSDAADIFQRVLMTVPDDFVSHVGMSIIRDDEGKLDEAIWHMERAFEVQPSNSAIQGELRRLYGRRDGVEPTKIRLSRDALANMYSQGELFNQAIAEIRAVLAEDPNRPDLQVMLSRARFHAGQKVEAADMAATLLKKYPYCLDALRVLVEVLPETVNSENTQVYRQRLRMLDPYTSFVTDSVFAADKVADTAVSLERLEYDPNAQPETSQPNWASSLGIQLQGDKRTEAAPDWLKNAETPKPAPVPQKEPTQPAAAPAAAPAGDDAPLPDWMRSSGWVESSGTAQESPAEPAGEAPAEPIAQAEIPDWLKSMAPAGAAGSEPVADESKPIDNSAFPDWLTDLGASAAPAAGVAFAAAAPPPPPETEQPTVARKQMEPAKKDSAEPVTKQTPKKKAVLSPQDETPFQPSGEVKPLGIGDDALGWLESLAAKQGAKQEELLTKPQERSDDMPDWLRSGDETKPAAQEPAQEPSPVAGAQDVMSETVVAPKQPPAPVAQKTVKPPAEPGKNPPKTMPLESASPSSSADSLDGFPPLQSPPEGTAKPVGIEDDTLAWLEQLAANQGAKPEELLSKPEERTGSMPDWIKQTAEEQPLAPAQAAAPADEIFTPQAEEAAPAAPPASEDNTILSWLNNLDKQEPSPQAETPASPPDASPAPSQEGLPDWLKGLEQAEAAPPAQSEESLPEWMQSEDKGATQHFTAETPAQAQAAETDMPDWLKETGQAGVAQMPGEAPASETDRPAWFDEAAPVSEEAAPTTPTEWVPVEEPAPPAARVNPAGPATPPASAPPVSFSVESAPTPEPKPRIVKGTGMLARIPTQDKDSDLLQAAQAALDNRALEAAMKEYGKLIKKGRFLDEVIHDLREAIYRYPVDVIIWQTLGDAYMRANRLQEALDAYTKAEELLR